MKRLCIIPARGGSKRLPGKNTKLLNGKPLVFYTIDCCIKSGLFDKIIFTSDDSAILNIVADSYSSVVNIEKRPADLSSDTSKVIDTVIHYIDSAYDQTWLTLPTSPLKTPTDFIDACKMLKYDVDSVISYTEMEFPPSLGITITHDSIIKDYDSRNPWQNGNSRSQDHPIVYRPNGAIYGAWTSSLKTNKNYYAGITKGLFMPRNRSIDIDTQFDFDFAGFILKTYQ
jgi:CMP-N,N'-diacetyllegionaminic acid synthase